MRDDLTKAQKRHYRELIGMVYERELSAELEKLKREFERWKAGKIDAFELEARIHKFHQGEARKLWKSYQYSSDFMGFIVASRVYRGILQMEGVQPQYRVNVEEDLRKIRTLNGEESAIPPVAAKREGLEG